MKNLSAYILLGSRLLTLTFLIALAGLSIFAASGDLDSSFGSNGFVFNTLGYPVNGGATGNAIAVQPDGKILLAGRRMVTFGKPIPKSYVARFNADGTLDAAFGSNGVILEDVGIFNSFTSIAVQPDGKIIAGGSSGNGSVSNFLVVRYNANGTRDGFFGSGGAVTTAFSQRADLASVLLQPSGKIIAAGYTFNNGQPTSGAFAVAGYNADGSLDSSFGAGGKVETAFENLAPRAWEAVLQPDGKIVVAGTLYEGAIFQDVRTSGALVRYNSNGSLDTNFGSGGKVITAFTESFTITAVALQTDGKIVGGGYRILNGNYDFAVVRYNTSGAPDSAFGTSGIVTTNFSDTNFDRAYAVLIQRNGKIVALGKSGASGANIALARYNPNGTLDANFGQGGKVITHLPQDSNEVLTAALQTDGKIVVGGNAYGSGSFKITLARFIGDAPRRPSFDFDGDGRTDVSVFRGGVWHLQRSQLGFTAAQWGVASDLVAPADFDGDGRTDLAVYRPSNGEWSVFNSAANTISIVRFGAPEDLPRPADFDGDGRADVCVWRPSNGVWYRLNSSNGQFAATAFGQAGDVPLVADFDGDGKSDISVFRPSNGVWYWLKSSDNQFAAAAFGANGDKPIAADYDGDGRTDIAVFRPSNGVWYRLSSQNGTFFAVQFGQAGDAPTLGDYDGDGRADIAVWRASNGIWYRLNSGDESFYFEAFGTGGDRPIPSAFVP